MGRPDHADAETQQTEYELQPQEYDPSHEPTPNIPDEYNQQAQQYEPQQQQQQQFQPPPQQPPPNQAYPQAQQQQFPPQQPPPNQAYPQAQQQQFPPQQQPMPQQYPPQQSNQAYPPPQRAAPYPPQNIQYNPNPVYPNQQPAAAAYPPQPVQFPPKSPATNQMYANVGPQGMQTQTGYAPNASPQAFPQPAFLPNDQSMQPPSPYKPGGQPPAVAGFPVGAGGVNGWRSGLFDFMDDPMNALVTAFFPCLTFGQIAEIVDDGHTTCGTSGMLYGGIAFCIALPCLLSCTYRTKLRNKFGLPEAPAPDWVTHFLCEWCALCQEYRELQHRGWDPSIGWQGNMARNQRQQPVMMAPVNQTMMG